ncbi:MAG: hypothetical protein HQK58_17645, partial [Deltaproteobacteria bacterium]|nr:hypothetical protein [Deltaproteobacteria bacterium]
SSDGKNIIACYAATTTDQVFEGMDITTGKTYRIRIEFGSSTSSTLTLTTLNSGKTDRYNMIKQTPAQPNPLSDGVWQGSPDNTQQFFFQTYVGGGALMLYTSNGTTAKVFYDNQIIEDAFSGKDIYNPHVDKMDAKLISAQSATATITPLAGGTPTTWNLVRFSTAKSVAKARP